MKTTLKILAFVALSWNLGASAFAQTQGSSESSMKAIQRSILMNELKTCLLPAEYNLWKMQVQPYLQQLPNVVAYVNSVSQKRCEVITLRALEFGMTREEIDEAIQQRYVDPKNEFQKPKKLYEKKTLSDEGGAHTG